MSTVEFPVEFESKPEQELDLVVHVFDSAGKPLKSTKVKNGKASLPLEILQEKASMRAELARDNAMDKESNRER